MIYLYIINIDKINYFIYFNLSLKLIFYDLYSHQQFLSDNYKSQPNIKYLII